MKYEAAPNYRQIETVIENTGIIIMWGLNLLVERTSWHRQVLDCRKRCVYSNKQKKKERQHSFKFHFQEVINLFSSKGPELLMSFSIFFVKLYECKLFEVIKRRELLNYNINNEIVVYFAILLSIGTWSSKKKNCNTTGSGN